MAVLASPGVEMSLSTVLVQRGSKATFASTRLALQPKPAAEARRNASTTSGATEETPSS